MAEQKPEDGTPFAWRGDNVTIHPLTILSGRDMIAIESDTVIDSFVLIVAHQITRIGSNCHIATGTSILGGGQFSMGDYSGVSAGCRVFTGSDSYTGAGMTGPTIPEEYRACDRSGVHIGDHAVVGANSVLLPGTVIEEGATIGAGSVVKGRVPAWTIYAGSIAKQIGVRDKTTVLALCRAFEANRK
jgi:acetyltransferase-like isoleucine patch superfamily enzyme